VLNLFISLRLMHVHVLEIAREYVKSHINNILIDAFKKGAVKKRSLFFYALEYL